MLDQRGWTDRIAPSPNDYLWVVDANLAALKTDGKMEKQVHYGLDLATGQATLTLRYHNTVRTPDWQYTRYRDYVRVYVPEGSTLIGVDQPGSVDVMHDLGKTVFGAFWQVEPGETRDLTFHYQLPTAFVERIRQSGDYRLTVQRQPGNHSQLTLDHAFGKNIQVAEPPEAAREFGDTRYRVTQSLDQDTTFHVRF